MKTCPICGCHNADGSLVCAFCGVNFPKEEAPVSTVPEVSAENPPPRSTPSPAPVLSEEDRKADRMAIAGFVLSVMGFFTCLSSPLQLAALILSLVSGKTKRRRVFRLIGIILSSVGLAVSLILWFFIAVNAELFLTEITDFMNEFYY